MRDRLAPHPRPDREREHEAADAGRRVPPPARSGRRDSASPAAPTVEPAPMLPARNVAKTSPGPSDRPATKKSPVARTRRPIHRPIAAISSEYATSRRSVRLTAGRGRPDSRECRSRRAPRAGSPRPWRRPRARRSYPRRPAPARVPVASAKIASPSPEVCAGTIARARPSCAICAILVACVFVNAALVATTPIVVCCSGSGARTACAECAARRGRRRAPCRPRFACRRRSGRSTGSMTSPRALTATSAATTSPSGSAMAALPSPPFIARPRPAILPTVAPAPAPTLPSATAAVGGRLHRGEAAVGGRPDRAVADAEVEQDRARARSARARRRT